jgi:hypothetical protein
MSSTEYTVRIAADALRLWEMVSDVTRMGEWSPETTGAHWLDGASGPVVGARFKATTAGGEDAGRRRARSSRPSLAARSHSLWAARRNRGLCDGTALPRSRAARTSRSHSSCASRSVVCRRCSSTCGAASPTVTPTSPTASVALFLSSKPPRKPTHPAEDRVRDQRIGGRSSLVYGLIVRSTTIHNVFDHG